MLLKRLWLSDAPFDYEGPYHRIRNGYVANRHCHPTEIRMTGRSGSALDVAGRHARVFELESASLYDIRTMMRRVSRGSITSSISRKLALLSALFSSYDWATFCSNQRRRASGSSIAASSFR